jgi:hypothetical protein
VGKDTVSLSTTALDAATTGALPAVVPLGITVRDSAILTTTATGIIPTGTVTYSFFHLGDCTTGSVVGTDTVTVGSGGSVAHSTTNGPLNAETGSYAYQATYSGDANYIANTSDCEPFDVDPGTANVATTVFDAATSAAVTGPLPAESSVFDTATLSVSAATVPPTGTVAYTFFRLGDCTTGTRVGTDSVTVGSGGSVPHSSTSGPLSAATGPFAYQASYSGDNNYSSDVSACEPFVVLVAGPSATSLSVTSITTSLSATTVLVGETVHDSSTLHGATPTAGGSVTYTAYSDAACTTVAAQIGSVTVSAGAVPPSRTFSLASAGTYYLRAAYSGDAANTSSTSPCTSEVLTVKVAPIGGVQTGVPSRGSGRLALPLLLLAGLLVSGMAALAAGRRMRRRPATSSRK